ncbi:CHAP domain-containing protein [Enterococcus sp. DIV1304_2]|uniref:CHAP domain-containing protein n=1 Tax=unclassified Enterococcus TaxID=2608891 RepID=UPI003D301264
MRINNRPKEYFKLPKGTRFKGEQRSLTVRKGTIAKFNQRAAYGYTLGKQKNESRINSFKGKKAQSEEKLKSEESSFSKLEKKGQKIHEKRSSKQSFLTDNESETLDSVSKAKRKKRHDKKKKKELENDLKKKKDDLFHTKQKESFHQATSKNQSINSDSKGNFSSSTKQVATKQLINQGFNVMAQEEDAEELKQFQSNVKDGERVFKGTKKANKFLTKNQKFSQSVTIGKLDDLRFTSSNTVKAAKPVSDVAGKAATKTATQQTAFSQASLKVQQAITSATSKALSSFTVSNPVGWIITGIALLFLVFIGLFFIFNSQSSASSEDGVFYVEKWDGPDAYNSSLLAQRYGITAEQIDGFIANEGYTVDSRATGQEFLRLQSLSGIDVRQLVAFAQWESSYGTAGVALQFPKSNIFGYGAFDNDPNQGASWDNTRAVTEFRNTQIDTYGNRTLAIMDARAKAFHDNTLKPGEFVYWTKLNAGKSRAETAEKFNQWIDDNGGTPKPPGGYGPVGGGGAGLAVLDQRLGTVIGGEFGGLTGECYAVSAYYANSINSSIILRGGVKASDIGTDYPWESWGWSVIKNPSYNQIKAGDIINYHTGGNMGSWFAHSMYGHTGVVGKTLGNNQYVLYDQNPGPLKTWTVTFHSGSVSSVVRPPN